MHQKIPFLLLIIFQASSAVEQQKCLSFNEEELTSSCLTCNYMYFYSNFALSAPQLGTFDPSDYLKKSENSFEVKEFFIRNFPCEEASSICNGTPSFPFDSFFQALKAAQSFSEAFLSSEVKILLLKSKRDPEEAFFWDSQADDEVYHFFRRVNVSLRISPFFCDEREIDGCFEYSDPKPIIYLRTEKNFVFVTNILSIEGVILDGSEIAFESLSFEKRLEFSHKRFCEENMLESEQNPFEPDFDRNFVCFLMRKSVQLSSDKNLGLFNFEPFFECDICLMQPVEIIMKNSEFRNFYSNGAGTNCFLSSLVSAQRLKFSLRIENCLFYKLSLLDGIFFTSEESVPSLFSSVNSLYKKAVEDQNLRSKGNNIIVYESHFFSLNFFKIEYLDRGILSFFRTKSTVQNWVISDCHFFENYIDLTSFQAFFLISMAPEQGINSDILIKSNVIQGNSFKRFLDYSIENANKASPRNKAILANNQIYSNRDCSFSVHMLDFIISGLFLRDISAETQPLFQINYGEVTISESMIQNVNSADISLFPVFKFVGSLDESIYNIFQVERSPVDLIDSLTISNCFFSQLFSSFLRGNYVLSSLNVFYSDFESSSLDFDLFQTNAESVEILTTTFYLISSAGSIFNIPYSKGSSFSDVLIRETICNNFFITSVFSATKNRPTYNFFSSVVLASTIWGNFFYVIGKFAESSANFNVNKFTCILSISPIIFFISMLLKYPQ